MNSTTMNRRSALAGTAAVGALALPAGAAVAATGDADPGLVLIEEGYVRWQAIRAERDRLYQIAAELWARAEEAIAPMVPPEPPIPPELEPYSHWNEGLAKKIVWWGTTPRKGKVGKIADAHQRAEIDWRHVHNDLLDRQPDAERACEVEAEREDLEKEADEVRRGILAIPTTSPRGLLIKLAVAVEVETPDAIDAKFEELGMELGFPGEDLMPPLLADLRAMVGSAAA